MIDVSKIKAKSDTIEVRPDDNIFAELGNNTYDFKDLLSELIDNSVAARTKGKLLTVRIESLAGTIPRLLRRMIGIFSANTPLLAAGMFIFYLIEIATYLSKLYLVIMQAEFLKIEWAWQ